MRKNDVPAPPRRATRTGPVVPARRFSESADAASAVSERPDG